MKRFLKIVAIVTCSITMLTMPSKADFGVAFGISGIAATFDTSGSEREGNSSNTNTATETITKSTSNDAVYAEGFLEALWKGENVGLTIGMTKVPGTAVLGAQARTDTASESGKETNPDAKEYKAKAKVSDYTQIYIEPTFYISDNFGIFAKAGISSLTVNTMEDLASGTDSSTYGDADIDGDTFGVGIRTLSEEGILLKLEYFETSFDTITLDSSTGNKNRIKADVEEEAIKLSVGYQF